MVTSLRRWTLVPLAAFLFLSVVPAVTEVVNSMSDCHQFLLEGNPPQVPDILEGGRNLDPERYKPVCQTFMNKRRFVTLYDTKNRIPVFSAYKYKGGGAKSMSKRPIFRIEPQLEERNINMIHEGYHQAINSDYTTKIQIFNRGHLFPASHAFDKDDKNSTFTLTNVVPQAVTFNSGSWADMEKCVKCILNKYCINNNDVAEGFVVTGALPSNNNQLKQRVNIPSVLWSAFCCYSTNKKMWLASAHWGDNVPDAHPSKYLQTKTLAELHQQLSTGNSRFEAFPRTQCPLHETVAKFYPEINADINCKCPPQDSTTTTAAATTSGTTIHTSIDKTSTISPTTTVSTTTTTSTTRGTTTTTRTTTKKNNSDSDQDHNQEGPGGGAAGGGAAGGAAAGGAAAGGAAAGGAAAGGAVAGGAVAGGAGGAVAGGAGGAVVGGAALEGATNTTNQIPTTFIPATSETQTNTTNQIPTTFIPATSDTQTNTTNQIPTTFISATSETQTNTTNQIPTTLIPATSETQTNTTNQIPTTFIPATSATQTNTSNQTSTKQRFPATFDPQTTPSNQLIISNSAMSSTAPYVTANLLCSYMFCVLFCLIYQTG